MEDDWKVVKEMDLGDFRVALTVKEGETLVTCGEIREFDTSYERVNPNHPVDLKVTGCMVSRRFLHHIQF